MVNSYVKDDMHFSESHYEYDNEIPIYGVDQPMTIHDWSSYYSIDLENMWNKIQDYLGMSGAGAYMLGKGDYTAFVEFCYRNSAGFMYSTPVGT